MKRDIYIKLENTEEIRESLKKIKELESDLIQLFDRYEKLNTIENKTCENWSNYLDEIAQRIDHISL